MAHGTRVETFRLRLDAGQFTEARFERVLQAMRNGGFIDRIDLTLNFGSGGGQQWDWEVGVITTANERMPLVRRQQTDTTKFNRLQVVDTELPLAVGEVPYITTVGAGAVGYPLYATIFIAHPVRSN